MSRDRTVRVISRVLGLRRRVLVAAVTALRSYLMSRTDAALSNATLAARPQLAGLDAEGEIVAWISSHEFTVGQCSIM